VAANFQLRHVVDGDHPVEQGQLFERIADAGAVNERLALAGTSGEMVALRKGEYTHVPISVTGEGKKVVRVDRLYDAGAYRPRIRGVAGLPMFLD
jgi:hypothetical protein